MPFEAVVDSNIEDTNLLNDDMDNLDLPFDANLAAIEVPLRHTVPNMMQRANTLNPEDKFFEEHF